MLIAALVSTFGLATTAQASDGGQTALENLPERLAGVFDSSTATALKVRYQSAPVPISELADVPSAEILARAVEVLEAARSAPDATPELQSLASGWLGLLDDPGLQPILEDFIEHLVRSEQASFPPNIIGKLGKAVAYGLGVLGAGTAAVAACAATLGLPCVAAAVAGAAAMISIIILAANDFATNAIIDFNDAISYVMYQLGFVGQQVNTILVLACWVLTGNTYKCVPIGPRPPA